MTISTKFLRAGAVLAALSLTAVAVPAAAQTTVEHSNTTDHNDGFNKWGLIGLLGLAGLMGRKRDRNVADSRRV